MATFASRLLCVLLALPYLRSELVDLSAPWQVSELDNKNQAHCVTERFLDRTPTAVGYLLVKDGKIVAEGYGANYMDADLYSSSSMAKSWINMLLGRLEQADHFSVDWTLGEIFSQTEDWTNAQQA